MSHAKALAEAESDRIQQLVEEHVAYLNAALDDLMATQGQLMDRYERALLHISELTQERDRLRLEVKRLSEQLLVQRLTLDMMERQQRGRRQ